MKDLTTGGEIMEKLSLLNGKVASKMIIIDGQSLSVALSNEQLEESFF
jgi:hypothetical protein